MPGVMLCPLLGRHGGETSSPLFGIPLVIAQVPIQFCFARATSILRHVPSAAAGRLPSVPITPPVLHGRFFAGCAVSLSGSAASRCGAEFFQICPRALSGNLTEFGRLAPTVLA